MKNLKKTLAVFMLAAVMVLASASAFATTSGTLTVSKTYDSGDTFIRTLEWTSNSSGQAGSNAVSASDTYDNLQVPASVIKKIVFDPDGTAAPTADYDVDINDANGYNVLLGLGNDRSSANTETFIFQQTTGIFDTTTLVQNVDTDTYVYPWEIEVQGRLHLDITDAGDTKAGTIIIYFERR